MNAQFRLKISEQDFEKLRHLVFLDLPREAGAFALAGISILEKDIDIIVRRPVEVPKEMFFHQSEYRLEISTQAINGLIALCELNQLGAIICHSHPEGLSYSPSDDYGEKRIFDTLRRFIPKDAPTVSLLFSPDGVTGRVWLSSSNKPVPLSEIIIIGPSIKRIHPNTAKHEIKVDDIYERQVRAFGKAGQAAIQKTRVGIVGVGGTGSSVAEQLTRLGTKDLVLIDHDEFDPTNITRVYGTYADSLQRNWWQFKRKSTLKVELVANNLKKIRHDLRIQVIPENIVLTDTAVKLLDRDVIFLCTDEHWGRSVVNQLVYQYFIPAINIGVNISSKDGLISAVVGVVDVLRPDIPCLWCSQFLNSERIATESMPRRSRQSLQREGYVEDVDTNTPSVVSLTTTVSGMAVTTFLQLITGFMGSNGSISRLNYNGLDGTVRRGTTSIRSECTCKKFRGFGNLATLPTLKDLNFLKE